MALKWGGGLLLLHVLAMLIIILMQPQVCNALSWGSMAGSALNVPDVGFLQLLPFIAQSLMLGFLSMFYVLGNLLTSLFGYFVATGVMGILAILLIVVPLLMRARTIFLVQVGLSRSNYPSLTSKLQQTARDTDTSSETGRRRILADTTQELLKDSKNFICGYSYRWISKNLSRMEREKLGKPLLVSVNEEDVQRAGSPNAATFCEDYILVTILVAVEGIHTIPTIRSVNAMKKGLQKLNTVGMSKMKALEVLWTPNDEREMMTQQNLLELFPDLCTLL